MDNLKKYGVLTLAILLAGFGPSMTIKAAVGLGAFDALNQTIAFITGFRVGDVLTVLNLLFVVAQLVILKKEANFRILLQVPLSAVFGQIILLILLYLFSVMYGLPFLLQSSWH